MTPVPSIDFLIFSLSGIFVAMDIIGVVPIYLGMTKDLSDGQKQVLLRQSITVAFLVALVFWVAGDWVFKILGITLEDFKVGGGIVLLVMSILELVRERRHTESDTPSTGVVPLGVPLITGPALITILMLQVGLYGHIVVIIGLTLNFAFAWLVLAKSKLLTRLLGQSGIAIISKIMALFTTAIAFALIRTGLMAGMRLP